MASKNILNRKHKLLIILVFIAVLIYCREYFTFYNITEEDDEELIAQPMFLHVDDLEENINNLDSNDSNFNDETCEIKNVIEKNEYIIKQNQQNIAQKEYQKLLKMRRGQNISLQNPPINNTSVIPKLDLAFIEKFNLGIYSNIKILEKFQKYDFIIDNNINLTDIEVQTISDALNFDNIWNLIENKVEELKKLENRTSELEIENQEIIASITRYEKIEQIKELIKKIKIPIDIEREMNEKFHYWLKPTSIFLNIANKSTLKHIQSLISNTFMKNVFSKIEMINIKDVNYKPQDLEILKGKTSGLYDVYRNEALEEDFVFLDFRKTNVYYSDICTHLISLDKKEKKLLKYFKFQLCDEKIFSIEKYLEKNGVVFSNIFYDDVLSEWIESPTILNIGDHHFFDTKTREQLIKHNTWPKNPFTREPIISDLDDPKIFDYISVSLSLYYEKHKEFMDIIEGSFGIFFKEYKESKNRPEIEIVKN